MDEDNKVTSVKIGFKVYEIKRPTEIIEVRGEYKGTADYFNETIQVANKLTQHEKNCTFIHEMLHGICYRFSLSDVNSSEETLDLLAQGFYEAILDNPHLFTMTDI